MHLIIEVEVRDVYGKRTIYPSNEQAKALAKIAGTRTLTPAVLAVAVQDLGAEVVLTGQRLTTWDWLAEQINAHP